MLLKRYLLEIYYLVSVKDNEHDGSKGLITGHAYSVTMANKIPTIEGTKICCVFLIHGVLLNGQVTGVTCESCFRKIPVS